MRVSLKKRVNTRNNRICFAINFLSRRVYDKKMLYLNRPRLA